MDTEVIDAPAASSPATGTAADQTAQGAPEVTPASPGAQADPTPTAADELAEFKADVAKATGKEPANAEPETKAEADPKTDEPEKAEVEEKGADDLSQNQDKVPEKLTERPEWQKLTAIADKLGKDAGKEVRGVLRGIFKREHELTVQVEKSKPALDVVREMMQSVGGSEQGFTNMRHLIKSFDVNPAGAVPMLETLLNDAKKRAGLVVSSPELKTEEQKLEEQIRDGVIDAESAERRRQELLELQQARLVREQAEAQRQAQSQREQQAKAQQAIQDLNQTEARWVADKQKADPDYPAVQNLHGAFTQKNALEFHAKHNRWPNAKEAIDLLDTSYRQAKAEAVKFKPAPKARQAVTGGQGSSGNNRQQPGSELDEFKQDVQMALKRRG
jgi:hypothetical protein